MSEARKLVGGIAMIQSRVALLAMTFAAATGLTLYLTAGTAPAADPCDDPESLAIAQLKTVAAAHGGAILSGTTTYTHFGNTVIAHAPLAGIQDVTADDLADGAPIMAIFVQGDESGRVPDGVYVVNVQFAQGQDDGFATYIDASGAEVVQLPAVMRDREAINDLFEGTYDDPPPPQDIPVISSTHVWHQNRWAVDCTGPGWGWKVFYY